VAAWTAAAVALAAPPAAAEGSAFLPQAFARLRGARYVPSDKAGAWTGWIGAGADLVRTGGATLEFTADVETIIGGELRTFDANQANYHLAVATRIGTGRVSVAPFLHHVSRHLVDRPKVQPVDWNIVGLRGVARMRGGRVHLGFGAGHTFQVSLVGYRFEFTGSVDATLAKLGAGAFYGLFDARRVTADPTPDFPRGSFTDLTVEAGVRWPRGSLSLDTFAAFERRNDVFVVVPGVRDRLLLGFRIGLVGR